MIIKENFGVTAFRSRASITRENKYPLTLSHERARLESPLATEFILGLAHR